MKKTIILFMFLIYMVFGETKTVEVVYDKFAEVHYDYPINVDLRIFDEGWIHMEESLLGKCQIFSIKFIIPDKSVYAYRHLSLSVGDIETKIDLVDWRKDAKGNTVLEYSLYNVDDFFRSTFGKVIGEDMSIKIYGLNKEVLYDVHFTPEAMKSFWDHENAYYKRYISMMNSRGGIRR